MGISDVEKGADLYTGRDAELKAGSSEMSVTIKQTIQHHIFRRH
jgi:hypothetical protein